jgi:hypothetical protein
LDRVGDGTTQARTEQLAGRAVEGMVETLTLAKRSAWIHLPSAIADGRWRRITRSARARQC